MHIVTPEVLAQPIQINSHEYKVMLKPEKFTGSSETVIKQAEEFWLAFEPLIEDMVIEKKGSLNELNENRAIRFYDTDDHLLNNSSYIFRERVDMTNEVSEIENKAAREATLKFRNRDFSKAQDRYISASKVNPVDKFEEDLKFEKKGEQVSIISLYSLSTKQPVLETQTFTQLEDIAQLYPDLKNHLKDYNGDLKLHTVGKITAREKVLEGAKFKLEEDSDKVKVKCALVLWYKNKINNTPEVVEFSFKYKDKNIQNKEKIAEKARAIFNQLQNDSLKSWINLEGMTKTAFVYSLDK